MVIAQQNAYSHRLWPAFDVYDSLHILPTERGTLAWEPNRSEAQRVQGRTQPAARYPDFTPKRCWRLSWTAPMTPLSARPLMERSSAGTGARSRFTATPQKRWSGKAFSL